MCDVCIKRARAYQALPDDESREAVDTMRDQWLPQLTLLEGQEFEDGVIAFGESLDVMLGLTPAFTVDDFAQFLDAGDVPVPNPLPPRHSSHPHYESDTEPRVPLITRWWKWFEN